MIPPQNILPASSNSQFSDSEQHVILFFFFTRYRFLFHNFQLRRLLAPAWSSFTVQSHVVWRTPSWCLFWTYPLLIAWSATRFLYWRVNEQYIPGLFLHGFHEFLAFYHALPRIIYFSILKSLHLLIHCSQEALYIWSFLSFSLPFPFSFLIIISASSFNIANISQAANVLWIYSVT